VLSVEEWAEIRRLRRAEGLAIVDLTARLLAGVARRDPDLMREVLLTALPWARFLPAHDVDAMADEFIATAQTATSIDNLAPVLQLLIEWRHTAEIHADPDLYRALSTVPLGDFGDVPRPGEEPDIPGRRTDGGG
jgi:hypothetical protein